MKVVALRSAIWGLEQARLSIRSKRRRLKRAVKRALGLPEVQTALAKSRGGLANKACLRGGRQTVEVQVRVPGPPASDVFRVAESRRLRRTLRRVYRSKRLI